jgi:hypothetical protein
MKSTRELAIIKFESKYVEKRNGLYVMPEFAINDLDYTQTIGEVVALPEYTGDFPSTLSIGDKVRCEYGSMDDKEPLDLVEDGILYHVHLGEILYKIHDNGVPEMQHGWVLGKGLPVEKPEWAAGHQVISGIPYWQNSAGHCIEKIDMTGQKNKMKVCGFGLPKPSLKEIPYKIGDIVAMLRECEFTNHNNNEILGQRYWFVRQEDIIGVIK